MTPRYRDAALWTGVYPEPARVPPAPPTPGPMPPHWERGFHGGRYQHETGVVVLTTDDGRAMVMLDLAGDLPAVESTIHDVAELLRWLKRGGK